MSGAAIALCAVWGAAVVISVIATVVSYVRTGKINTGILNLFSLFSPPTPTKTDGVMSADAKSEPSEPEKAAAADAAPSDGQDVGTFASEAKELDAKVRSALVSVLKLALEELRDDAAGQSEKSDRVNWVLGGGSR